MHHQPTLKVPPTPILITPEYDPDTGWATNTLTPVGGLRGKQLDQAIADIIAAGAPEIAAHIPRFVVGRIWDDPDAGTSIMAPDPQRFAGPTPEQMTKLHLTADQVIQIIDNQRLQNDFNVGGFMGNPNNVPPQNGYRGEEGREGFAKYTPTEETIFTADGPQTITRTAQMFALSFQWFYPSQISEQPGTFGRVDLVEGKFYTDHILLDTWWALLDDWTVARYFRNWAIKVAGVNIDPEPVA